MLRLIGVMISIGLADAVNPSTVAPGLYLASLERGRRRVLEFTLGVFSVYLLGGIAIALGPGELVLSLVPRPSHDVGAALEIAAGAALLLAAGLLVAHRESLGRRQLPGGTVRSGRSSFLLGAGIMAVELPTAFPYFAAIAATVGSDLGVARQLILLVIFNVCFVLPLLGILAALTIWGERGTVQLARARALVERHWPSILACVALAGAAIAITLGATGLAGRGG